MTRTMTILALACFLVVGAAVASIIGRDSVPAVRADIPTAVAKGPLANREGKKDKLPLAMAALPPAADDAPRLPEQLRQAFASDSPFAPQNLNGNAILLAHQAQQKVLGTDIIMIKP